MKGKIPISAARQAERLEALKRVLSVGPRG
jgi:hypothetical protein